VCFVQIAWVNRASVQPYVRRCALFAIGRALVSIRSQGNQACDGVVDLSDIAEFLRRCTTDDPDRECRELAGGASRLIGSTF
jgi:hypothetical protein